MWNDSDNQFSIPNDEKMLTKALGLSIKVFRKIFSEIQNEIDPILREKDGFLISERLKEEKRKQDKYRRDQSIKGKKSAEARRNRGTNNGSTVVQPEYQPDTQPEGNSSSSSSTSINKNTKVFFVEDSDPYKLAVYLRARILENLPTAKVPQATPNGMQKWSEQTDKMIRLDNRDPQSIQRVIEFATTDSFWKSNILSTKKLREKYDQLYLRMNNDKGGGKNERNGRNPNQGTGKYASSGVYR